MPPMTAKLSAEELVERWEALKAGVDEIHAHWASFHSVAPSAVASVQALITKLEGEQPSTQPQHVFAICPECKWRTRDDREPQHRPGCSRPEPTAWVNENDDAVAPPPAREGSVGMSEPYVWMVVPDDGATYRRYRAELWLSPWNGTLIASTRWTTKAWAARDGQRLFSAFERLS